MIEYLLSFYVIWECIVGLLLPDPFAFTLPCFLLLGHYMLLTCLEKLNALAEITRFVDRGYYGDWWNSVSWDQFAHNCN